MNLDELIATAQPRTETVRVCARGDLVEKHAAAVAAYQAALDADDSLAGSHASREAAGAVQAIEAEQDAHTVSLTVRAVSRNEWADLLASNAPTKEQRRSGYPANPDTFPVAVVAACTVELAGDETKAQELAGVLHMGEWAKLENTALRLNGNETPHPKLPAATELLQANEGSSTTPPPAASPEDGSLAGSGAQ